jgi:alpha-glucosidase
MSTPWWRGAVLYQVYLRSFADSDGDGLGDFRGLRERLGHIHRLGVDGVWLTPFYPSPDADHGYDVADYVAVDPRFGSLAEFDAFLADAHALGLRVIVDLVPNHTSSEHPWFRNALSSPDHPDRRRYVFRPGRDGGPPNNWPSSFGGPAWTLDEASGEYYLHMYAPEQPDLDWHEPTVPADFEAILRFWLDRGVDGFRIDVAHGLFKDPLLRDEPEPFPDARFSSDWRAAIDQPELHPLYRSWRRLVDGYPGERVLVGEVTFSDPARVAPYLRPDELQLAFNFTLLFEPWDAEAMRDAIDATLAALEPVGATPTWVLESHDVPRVPTRYGHARRGRAAALLLLALPGTAFLYAGQELGLPEVDLPDGLRQDPVFHRTGGARKGRDGCRVPLPWTAEPPGYGFTAGSAWLPLPDAFGLLAVAQQEADAGSTLALHRRALAARRASPALREGSFAWLDSPPGALVFERRSRDETVVCAINLDTEPLPLPEGEIVLASALDLEHALPAATAAWIRPDARAAGATGRRRTACR